MKVKVLQSFHMSDSSVSILAGSVLELPYYVAKKWLASGIMEEAKEAETITETKIVETAPANKVVTKRQKK